MFVSSVQTSLSLKNQLHLITCKVVKTCVTKAPEGLTEGKVFNDFHCFFSQRFFSLPESNPHAQPVFVASVPTPSLLCMICWFFPQPFPE